VWATEVFGKCWQSLSVSSVGVCCWCQPWVLAVVCAAGCVLLMCAVGVCALGVCYECVLWVCSLGECFG